jgi:hypothetical protein
MESVAVACRACIRRHKHRQILELEGTIDYDPTFDYEAARSRGRRSANKRIPHA